MQFNCQSSKTMTCQLFIALTLTIIIYAAISESAHQRRKRPRLVQLRPCECEGLDCNCCATIDVGNGPNRDVCAKFMLNPNEVTFKGSLTMDGNVLFAGQLDPSIAPICTAPVVGICLAINHVDVQRRQVCTKLYVLFLTLAKFPCVGAEDGKLIVEPNNYS
ncbi:unnamed protein product [Phyllotreta striolata]|uniref:DUF4773 domain-containing protein n=1 Tax=Phyllotreta striolata TaxID=444603 RepID=A0A9N9THR3_PHYSR|nr:unnamed protein product [Phyllotreta striolata]